MSDTLVRIRKSWMMKRKDQDLSLPEVSFLAMLVSECEMIGKNDGNRDTTEEEVQKHLRKVLKGVIEMIGLAPATDLWSFHIERQFIEALLPQMTSEEDLKTFIAPMVHNNQPIGVIMGAVKKNFGANADMKMASKIIKENNAA